MYGRQFKGLVDRFNDRDSAFRQRCGYVLSRVFAWSAASYHIQLCPSVTKTALWKTYKPSDPIYVGNKGGVVFQVITGTLRLFIHRNSLTKSEYIRTHREEVVHVLNFAQNYLEPEAEGFADRQASILETSHHLSLYMPI